MSYVTKKEQTPVREGDSLKQIRVTDNSLSFSLTQKAESNFKRMNDFDFSTKKSNATGTILPGLARLEEEAEQSSLNDELMMLQSKLNHLQQKFLNMSTPQKIQSRPRIVSKRGAPAAQPAASKSRRNQQNINTSNYHSSSTSYNHGPEPKKEAQSRSKQCAVGKIVARTNTNNKEQQAQRKTILSTSAYDSSSLHQQYYQGRDSLNRSIPRRNSFDNRSNDSIRSLERSKNKEIAQLNRQLSKCRLSLDSSKSKESRLKNKVQDAEMKIKGYKELEKEHRRLKQQHLKALKMLEKSQIIRQKQKIIIQQHKAQIKSLKTQLINPRKPTTR